MMRASLHPPLSWIERGLFGDDAVHADDETDREQEQPAPPRQPQEDADHGTGEGGWSPAQLAMLMATVRQSRLEVRSDLMLAPGQIRQLVLPHPPQRPVHLLVDRVGPLLVHGWLVVSEVDYASDLDWILQDDEVSRPLALGTAVVQLWNRRQLPLACLGGSVNEVGDENLQAIRAVASQLLVPGQSVRSDPQATFSVTELAGVEYVTGAPLTDGARHCQERQAYRDLYERWAETLVAVQIPRLGISTGAVLPTPGTSTAPQAQPARAEQASTAAAAGRASATWRTLALASMVALAVAVIWPLTQTGSDTDAERFRSVLPSGVQADRIQVHLSGQTPVQALSEWLVRWSAQVVSGPDESGAFVLLVPKDKSAGALADLQGSPMVEKAQMKEIP